MTDGGDTMFYRLRNSLARFMMGRYGNDQLNNFLLGTYLVLWLVGLFLPRGIPGAVVYWLRLSRPVRLEKWV